MKFALLAALAPLALAPAALAQTTYFVDADGTGDFLDLQSAVDAAVDGDVLLLDADTFPELTPVHVSKNLTIAGQPGLLDRPYLGHIFVMNTTGVTLSGLRLKGLAISNVSGTVNLERLHVYPEFPGLDYTPSVVFPPGYVAPFPLLRAIIEDAPDVRVIRSVFLGAEDYNLAAGSDALTVRSNSHVSIVSSQLIGADVGGSGTWAGWGGHALLATTQSHVRVVDSLLKGGSGESIWQLGFVTDPGKGGIGLLLLQGASANVIYHGDQGPTGGIKDSLAPTMSWAADLENAGTGSLVIEGAPAGVLVNGVATEVAHQTPYLGTDLGLSIWNDGLPAPGSEWAAFAHGPAGAVGLLAISTAPAKLTVPGLQGELEVAATASVPLYPFVFGGFDAPTKIAWTPPATPGITGLDFYVQAAQFTGGGALQATNAVFFSLNQ